MSLAALVAALALVMPFRLVLEAPDDAPPDTSLTWRAWTPGFAAQAEPVAADELVGAEEARTLAVGLPPEGGRWTVVVEGSSGGDAWFAVAGLSGGVERAPLTPVPVPSPAPPAEGRVALSWERSGVGHVAGWQVLRISAGGEPELVGEVAPGATAFRDEPPPGEHSWSLRPVFVEGATGPLGRASDPVVVPAAD